MCDGNSRYWLNFFKIIIRKIWAYLYYRFAEIILDCLYLHAVLIFSDDLSYFIDELPLFKNISVLSHNLCLDAWVYLYKDDLVHRGSNDPHVVRFINMIPDIIFVLYWQFKTYCCFISSIFNLAAQRSWAFAYIEKDNLHEFIILNQEISATVCCFIIGFSDLTNLLD